MVEKSPYIIVCDDNRVAIPSINTTILTARIPHTEDHVSVDVCMNMVAYVQTGRIQRAAIAS